MDFRLRRYAELAVPRYTSYPTAADFSANIGQAQHVNWLRRINDGERVSLYLHVPYCQELCHYCGCFTKVTRRESVIEAYAEELIGEIKMVGRLLTAKPIAERIHWGGGTPSILGKELIRKITDVLRQYFDFSPKLEYAIELDPRTMNDTMAQGLAQIGINRVSLGVQDTNADVQKAIGRIQPLEQVKAAVTSLRDAGIENLNFDLIYGLPLQTAETLKETCRQIAMLKPQRVACYGYAHLPSRMANQRLIDSSLLPNVYERYEQSQIVADTMGEMGYSPVGIDHYALAGDGLLQAMQEKKLYRNFQGYTDDDIPTLIGFGASSISQFREGYAQNIADIGQYKRAISAGKSVIRRGYEFSGSDKIRATIIEVLMCNFYVDLNEIAPDMDFTNELALLRPLASDRLVKVDKGKITMTAIGRPLVRLVAAVFDEFRKDCNQGFSMAV